MLLSYKRLERRLRQLLKLSFETPIIVIYSGVSTIGRNSYLLFYRGKVFVIDYGIGFPDINVFNIRGIIPDLRVLEILRKHVAAFLFTHAHLDHVGGFPYLLKSVPELVSVPILGSRFTIEFITRKLKEFKLHNKVKTKVIRSGEKHKINGVEIEYIHVTHSIPHSMMVGVKTDYGRIVYTGDYKFDATPIAERPSDTHIIEKWAEEGILAALLDSTNAYEKGHSKSETSIMASLEEIMLHAPGRVIIGMFSSLVSRMIAIIEIAKRLKKKVAFTGRSMEDNVRIARRIGYLTADADVLIPIDRVSKFNDKQLIILSTGSQGEYEAGLMKMARGKHDYIKLKSTDTIILSSSVIPTNVISVQELMDLLAHTGATVINSKLMNVHVSGHAYQEEMIQMAYLLNAKYYIPVHGYPAFLFQHKKVLVDSGIESRRVWVPTEGSVYTFPQGKLEVRKKLQLLPYNMISDTIISAADPLLDERKQMAANGIVNVVVDIRTRKVFVTHAGIVPKNNRRELTDSLKEEIYKVLRNSKSGKMQHRDIRDDLYAHISNVLQKDYKVTPVLTIKVV